MAQVINTNVMSLNSQRHLGTSQGALAQSLARLSSGLRINSAKDDAAGLAIAERFTTQIRGMNQAIRNSNDGISLAQVAEGSLQEVANNLQRIRELAVQSRNASNSASDREALDAEVQQRIAEINRVAGQTEFNGLKVLDGSFTEQVFQVGANFGQTISVDAIAAATGQALGLAGGTLTNFEVDGTAVAAALNAGDLTIDGIDIGAVSRDAAELAAAINGAGTVATATATNSQDVVFDDIIADGDAGDGYSLSIDGNVLFAGVQTATDADDVAAAITALDGYTAVNDTGTITISKADGSNFELVETITDDDLTTGQTGLGFGAAATTYYGSVSLTSGQEFTIAGATVASAGLAAGAAAEVSEAYTAINVLDAGEADTVMRVVDDALTLVNGSRADLGAVQNRFESVVANLSTTVENLSASRSRIMDTDFAQETAALSRAQVLQQAGVAMLAQANLTPQNVLALLR